MAKPTLQELLKKHGTKNDSSNNSQNEEFTPRNVEKSPEPAEHPGLKSKNIKSLFIELPAEKRFRLSGGQQINNLMELYEEILNMPESTFYQHVNEKDNDFAKWVKETLGESGVASRLYQATNRDEFIFVLAEEIKHLEDQSYRRKALLNPNFSYIVQKSTEQEKQEPESANTDYLQQLFEMVSTLTLRMENMESRIEEISEKVDKVQEENRNSIKNLSESMKKRYKDLQNELHELENLEREVEWRRKHLDIMEKQMPGGKQ